MDMFMTRNVKKSVGMFFSLIAIVGVIGCKSQSPMLDHITEGTEAFQSVQTSGSPIPQEELKSAVGVAILKCFQAGVVFGWMGGNGVAVKKLPGGWSAPIAIGVVKGDFGALIGAQHLDIVMVFNDATALINSSKVEVIFMPALKEQPRRPRAQTKRAGRQSSPMPTRRAFMVAHPSAGLASWSKKKPMKRRTARVRPLLTSSMESFLSLQAGSNFRKNSTLVTECRKLSTSEFHKKCRRNRHLLSLGIFFIHDGHPCFYSRADCFTVRCVDNIRSHFDTTRYRSNSVCVGNSHRNNFSNIRTQRNWSDSRGNIQLLECNFSAALC